MLIATNINTHRNPPNNAESSNSRSSLQLTTGSGSGNKRVQIVGVNKTEKYCITAQNV